MNRQKILVAACVLASVSIGANVWLWQMRKNQPTPPPATADQKPAPPGLPQAGDFDFSGTSFADDSWKLDVEKPAVPNLDGGSTPAPASGEVATGEKPVFKDSGLGDDAWKLGNGSKKEPPVMGPARGPAPAPAPAAEPPPAKPASGAASSGETREISLQAAADETVTFSRRFPGAALTLRGWPQ